MKKNYNLFLFLIILLAFTPIIVISCNSQSNRINETETQTEMEISDEDRNKYRDIYDDNDKIINNTGSVFIVSNSVDCWSNDEIKGSMDLYNGIMRMWKLDAKQDSEVSLNSTIQLENGRFKVLLISPDKKVENILEYTSKTKDEKQELKFNVKQGENIVYMVGDLAKITYDFLLDAPDEQVIIDSE